MKTLVLSGGFHNSSEIRIRVKSDAAVEDYKNGNVALYDILTESQDAKLRRHFCGINGCTCGSYMRADVEIL